MLDCLDLISLNVGCSLRTNKLHTVFLLPCFLTGYTSYLTQGKSKIRDTKQLPWYTRKSGRRQRCFFVLFFSLLKKKSTNCCHCFFPICLVYLLWTHIRSQEVSEDFPSNTWLFMSEICLCAVWLYTTHDRIKPVLWFFLLCGLSGFKYQLTILKSCCVNQH